MTSTDSTLYYLPEKNAYFLVGRALVTDKERPGYKQIIQDGEFVIPRKPDRQPEPLETVVMRIDKPNGYCAVPEEIGDTDGAERIQNIDSSPLVITRRRGTDDLTIRGKAKFLPLGTIYQNQVIGSREFQLMPFKAYDLSKLDFGSLSKSEIKVMQGQIALHNKLCKRFSDAQKLYAQGGKAVGVWAGPSHEGSSYGSLHPGLRFETIEGDGFTAIYFLDRNIYRILGSVRVRYRDRFHPFERIVTDSEFEAPCEPERKAVESLR